MTNTEADEGRYQWAMYGERLPFDQGRYGSTDIPSRAEVEAEETA